ncbi:alkaline phosphatase family protein [Glaciimonas sp. GG7]
MTNYSTAWLGAVEPGLAHLTQSIFASLGVLGFKNRLSLVHSRAVCLLVIDGLGWKLLQEYASNAPFLWSLANDNVRITAGFPATTAAALASLGSGFESGRHGIVGSSFAIDDATIFCPLPWTISRHDGVIAEPPVLDNFLTEKTAWECAREQGVRVSCVIPRAYAKSHFTQAVFKADAVFGASSHSDVAALSARALPRGVHGFCYVYHGEIDLCGHLYGPGSNEWCAQLRHADRMAQDLATKLSKEVQLIIVADHGMTTLLPSLVHDFDSDPLLQSGIRTVAGDVRARHVYIKSEDVDKIQLTWSERLEDNFIVLQKRQAILQGWFGLSVSNYAADRIGDLVVVPTGRGGIICSRTESGPSSWKGHHGSMNDDDQLVPLLITRGLSC